MQRKTQAGMPVKDQKVQAFVTGSAWPKGERKVLTLKSVRAGGESHIEILGQSGEVMEYRPGVNPKAGWTQDQNGLHISAMRAQRLYNNNQWPNPVVVRITNAEMRQK